MMIGKTNALIKSGVTEIAYDHTISTFSPSLAVSSMISNVTNIYSFKSNNLGIASTPCVITNSGTKVVLPIDVISALNYDGSKTNFYYTTYSSGRSTIDSIIECLNNNGLDKLPEGDYYIGYTLVGTSISESNFPSFFASISHVVPISNCIHVRSENGNLSFAGSTSDKIILPTAYPSSGSSSKPFYVLPTVIYSIS